MNTIDLVLLLPICLSLIGGYRKGFIIEVVSLLAFILALVACLKLTHITIEFIRPLIGESKWIPFAGYIITFLAVYILIMWIGKLLEKVVKIMQLGTINRVLGALFSLLKMCFAISTLFWLIDQVHLIPNETKQGSVIYRALHHASADALTLVSNQLPLVKGEIEAIEKYFDKKIRDVE